MNERIKELIIQTDEWLENNAQSDRYEREIKFAELIVRQCADIADSIGEHGYIASEEMLEQFGVK